MNAHGSAIPESTHNITGLLTLYVSLLVCQVQNSPLVYVFSLNIMTVLGHFPLSKVSNILFRSSKFITGCLIF